MDDRKRQTGQEGEERVAAYKLNKITMNGDDGKFYMMDLLGEKDNGKFRKYDLGESLDGVILKMRWQLSKYEEKDGFGKFTTSSEYDNKNKDTVIIFGEEDRGLAANMKERYGLGTQRILYVYMPKQNQIVRLVVKATALSSEKNPNKEMGLFDYVDSFNETGKYIDDYFTHFSSVFRENKENKRKSHYATVFSSGKELSEEQKLKVAGMREEVHQKTTAMKVAAPEAGRAEPDADDIEPTKDIDYPKEEINPDDIPF